MRTNIPRHKNYNMAKRSKYTDIIPRILPKDKLLTTTQIIRLLKEKEKKNVHYYLVNRVMENLCKEGKVEKQEVELGKGNQKMFLWKLR